MRLPRKRRDALAPRNRQILIQVRAGWLIDQVAAFHGISPQRVSQIVTGYGTKALALRGRIFRPQSVPASHPAYRKWVRPRSKLGSGREV